MFNGGVKEEIQRQGVQVSLVDEWWAASCGRRKVVVRDGSWKIGLGQTTGSITLLCGHLGSPASF